VELAGILVRATFTYGFLLALVRLSGKRTIMEGTPFDLVVALIVGDVPDDMIWGEVPLAQGIVAMGSLVLLHAIVVYGSYRSPAFDRLVGSRPARIVRGGRLEGAAMAGERVNAADLESQLRGQELKDLTAVRDAWVEPSGQVSVIRTREARAADRSDEARLRAVLG
jgi:uncharacterized membrane protein YcaP (DUF421 family)